MLYLRQSPTIGDDLQRHPVHFALHSCRTASPFRLIQSLSSLHCSTFGTDMLGQYQRQVLTDVLAFWPSPWRLSKDSSLPTATAKLPWNSVRVLSAPTFMRAYHVARPARLAGWSTNASPQCHSSPGYALRQRHVNGSAMCCSCWATTLIFGIPTLFSQLIPKRRKCHGQKSGEALNISDFTPWDAPMSTNDIVQDLRKLLTLNAVTKHYKTMFAKWC